MLSMYCLSRTATCGLINVAFVRRLFPINKLNALRACLDSTGSYYKKVDFSFLVQDIYNITLHTYIHASVLYRVRYLTSLNKLEVL